MNKELISKLQPLFNKRDSLVRAQDKCLETYGEMEICFIDSTFVLDLTQAEIKSIISDKISNIDNSICEIADAKLR